MRSLEAAEDPRLTFSQEAAVEVDAWFGLRGKYFSLPSFPVKNVANEHRLWPSDSDIAR
jgi:hypothetical protein